MRGAVGLVLIGSWCCASDLQDAIKAGDLERVKSVLSRGDNVNARDALGSTPLHDAAWIGDEAITALLIDRGADIDARHEEGGSTPLHYAVIKNNREVAALLVARGADIKATYRSGATALHLAAERF
jgi:cytohesin